MGMLWGSEDAPGFPRHALVSGSVAAGCASGNSSTGRIVARDAVAPSTVQDTPKQVSDTGPAWEGACARRGRGGGRGGGRQGRGDGAETRSPAREADARRGRRRPRGGGRGEGARTVHAARVRASIAIAAEVQPRRAGASARARPARGAARDAIAELDKGTTSRSKTARGGEGIPRAASPAPRRDALRRLRRRRRSPGDEMARARPPCSPRSETTERARSSVRPSRAEVLSIGSRARLEAWTNNAECAANRRVTNPPFHHLR